jgi:hypothetical protein
MSVMTAASYESRELVTEPTPASVRAIATATPDPSGVMQVMTEAVFQEVVLQMVVPIRTEGVRLDPPKFEPRIVSCESPVVGKLNLTLPESPEYPETGSS